MCRKLEQDGEYSLRQGRRCEPIRSILSLIGFRMPAIRTSNTVLALFVFLGLAISSTLSSVVVAEFQADQRQLPSGNSSREARDSAVQGIPYNQLTSQAAGKIRAVVEHSSFFRRMPTQVIDCEPEMFTFLVRNPEVIVNIWDVMAITRVSLQRLSQYQHQGDDGSGTRCKIDLVFGNDQLHVYQVNGSYQGNLWPKELLGQSVIVLHHSKSTNSDGSSQVTVKMDVFLKIENIGADLVVRTLGPLVSRSADYNFIECVAFVSQVSQAAVTNPQGLQNLASRLQKIDPIVREQFIATAKSVRERSSRLAKSNAAGISPSGYTVEEVLAAGTLSSMQRVPTTDSLSIASDPRELKSTRRGQTVDTVNGESNSDSPTIQRLNNSNP